VPPSACLNAYEICSSEYRERFIVPPGPAAASWEDFPRHFRDGSEERFADYFFAIYRCSPDKFGPEDGVNEHRNKLREEFPAKAITIGRRFVLFGQPAWLALAAYYQALTLGTPRDDFRVYAKERLDDVTKAHRDSQSLAMPIDLSEGQLAGDRRMEFLTRLALSNGQIFNKLD
jgi:hypothetical protein